MTVRLDQSWCPTCNEWSCQDTGRPCSWCDTPTVTRRGGWKRPDARARSRITTRQARALHVAHQQGRSLRDLSRTVYQALGYASANSCLEGIRSAFDREGLEARDPSEATRLANELRGGRLPGEDKNAYRRRIRREHGYVSPRTGEWRVAQRSFVKRPA